MHRHAFPVGPVTTSNAAGHLPAALTAPVPPSPRRRVATMVAGAILVTLSRVVVVVHGPTDVTGVWALGLAVAHFVLVWASIDRGGARSKPGPTLETIVCDRSRGQAG